MSTDPATPSSGDQPSTSTTPAPSTSPTTTETYSHGYSDEHRRFLAQRSAATDASFFLPHLRPGMRVLDCGCGQGSITVGLAQAVAPDGAVLGIDREPSQIEAARAWAAARGVGNVRFEVASIYDLPADDASFDAAFAHTVLEHLSDPPRAIREMRRVLKPGGVIGIKDPIYATRLLEPATPETEAALSLYARYSLHNGASPHYAHHLRRLLREAGFVRTEASSSLVGGGRDGLGPQIYDIIIKPLFRDPGFVSTVIAQGWADHAQIDAMVDVLEDACASPDFYFTMTFIAAVGWLPAS